MSQIRPRLDVFLSFSAVQAAQMFLPLMALPYLSRVLGSENFGILLYMLNISTLAAALVDWGFSITGTRAIAELRGNQKEIAQKFSAVLSGRLILVIFACLVGFLAAPFLSHTTEHLSLYLASIVYGAVLGLNPTFYFQGAGHGMVRMAVVDTLSSSLALIFTFLFIKKPEQLTYYIYVLIFCKSWGYFIQTRHVTSDLGIFRLSLRNGISCIKECAMYFLSRISGTIYTQGSILLIGQILSPSTLGMLVVADKIARAIVSLASPLISTLFPELCNAKLSNMKSSTRLLKVSFFGVFVAMIFLATLVYFTAPWIMPLVLGDSFDLAVPIMRVFCLLIPILAANTLLGTQFLVANNKENTLTAILSLVAFIALPLAWILATTKGVFGASLVPVLNESIIFTLILISLYRFYNEAKLERGNER